MYICKWRQDQILTRISILDRGDQCNACQHYVPRYDATFELIPCLPIQVIPEANTEGTQVYTSMDRGMTSDTLE